MLLDVVGEIMVRMNKTRKQIVDKLIELGLVEDRKTLRKPRQRRAGRNDLEDDGDRVHIGGRSSGSGRSS